MLLAEIFPNEAGEDGKQPVPSGGEMTNALRQTALDIITPLLGTNVPFIPMQYVMDKLSTARFGITITPALIQQILDPNQVKAIDRIENDRIYLVQANGKDEREVDDAQKQQDQQQVADMATNQINSQMKQQS